MNHHPLHIANLNETAFMDVLDYTSNHTTAAKF